ncbi:MAG: leucine--tRNA ligase [Patescibacteria group bacterium]
MHKKFDSGEIEKKWQAIWKESGIYNVGERDLTKPKSYVLVEWPYPSGNLHIGHWYAFAVPDIYARYKRMTGHQVLYPMGFDAFGLPAENAAIKRNLNPKDWTYENMAFMREQLERMGNMFSWDKTTNSTDQDYYKWTQWMFTQFFEKGIAYRGKGIVNWCPGCNTAVANEQVLADGTCERSGDMIEKREMPQWMMKITDYADRLIDDLDTVAWPEHIKEAQRQWIGRSKGAKINFTLSTGDVVTVFTTRPDTLFGATYLVLAPEHPLLSKSEVRGETSNLADVDVYVKSATQKDEQDRLDATKEKTGVKLDAVFATNPASGEQIPVYVADYVLGGYGTGAIMAVPAHDERDYAFATKFELPVKCVTLAREIISQMNITTNPNERDGYSILLEKYKNGEGFHPGYGTLINSGEFDGMDSEEAQEKIVAKVGGEMTSTYRLRDWSIGRQRYWGVPIPIVYSPEGEAHIVPKEHLPWVLPEDVDFKPTGVAPLAKSEALKKRTEEIFGAGWTPEVETMDTFVDSSWYFLRYLDNKNEGGLASLEAQKEWMPIDMYFGGAEHTTMHLLYSRFWQKALFDLGLVTESEPYKQRVNHGMILGPDGNKMSKSKGNVVDPDAQVALVGADTVKIYLAFMGPYADSSYPWDFGGIAGVRRFLERVYGLVDHIGDSEPTELTRQLHKTIAKVGTDILEFKYNTAISAMMILVNLAEKGSITKASYELFVRILAPFAPHLTEEIWTQLGHTSSVHAETFPVADMTLAIDETVVIGVQINGKLRGNITIAPDATEGEALNAVQDNPLLQEKLLSGTLKKVIYVPGRILNLLLQ